MTVDYFRKLVDYNYWAHRRVWTCVTALTDEQWKHPHPYSVGSLHEQLVHTMQVEHLWLRRIEGEREARVLPASHYPTRDAIRRRWDEIEAAWRGTISTLNTNRLNLPVSYISLSDHAEHHTPLWTAILHCINHSTDHRAQTLALAATLGAQTVEQDLVFYSWQHLER